MSPRPRFLVALVVAFSARELYDDSGRLIHRLDLACEVAESIYGAEWREVYNGIEGITRDDYLSSIGS